MEAVAVAQHIEAIIGAIKLEGQRSKDLIETKANAMRVYDKAIAVNELQYKADGMAVTLIGHQAKGDASQLMCEMIIAQEGLKAHWHRLEYLKAQLNGYQSIFRMLEHT